MVANKKPWYKRKTTWAGVAAIVTGGIGGFVTGTIDTATAIQTIIGGFTVIFGRDAIEGLKE